MENNHPGLVAPSIADGASFKMSFSKLDAQELELDDTLEKMSKEFQTLFEAQLEKSEMAKLGQSTKKSNLKKSKSEATNLDKLKMENVKTVRSDSSQGFLKFVN